MSAGAKEKFVLLMAIAFAVSISIVQATEEQEETLSDKLKHLFVRPTPTPKPRKKHRPSPSPAESKSPRPAGTPVSETSAAETTVTPAPPANETPAPTAEMKSPTPVERAPTQYFDAVRPMTPRPGARRSSTAKRTPTPTTPPVMQSPAETEIKTETETETETLRPMPSLPSLAAPSTLHTPAPSATAARTPPAIAQKTPAAAISVDQISDSSGYSPEIRKIVDMGLDLTGRNLSYKYVSADPKNGGMDSSGFIYYVLTQSGLKDAPRDAREQYIWVRKAGNFNAVLAQRDDTFELDGLKPGDLLFWASNYGVSKDPDITQTMIYLGREKGTNQRLMVGASESRSTRGQKKPGVGVFEFKVGHTAPKPNQENGPVFVGYGRIPGTK